MDLSPFGLEYDMETPKRLSRSVALAVVMACLVLAVGCRKGGTDAQPDRSGSWAQVTDILANVTPPTFPEAEFNILDHGAEGDGQTDCRDALLAAISKCTQAGGGRVLVPAGTYLVNGSLYFESNVNLHLAEGATIEFGTKFDDYYPLAMTRWAGTRIYNYCPFIYAYRKHNVAITGAGTLDGQAAGIWDAWKDKEQVGIDAANKANAEGTEVVDRYLGEKHFLRPSMVEFLGCEGVLVEGVTFANAPYHCLHPVFAQNVTISDVKFDSHNPDNDAIAVDSCQGVHITGVTFDNSGAGVAIVSGSGREGRELSRPSRNVYIHDCTFKSDAAIAIGPDLGGGVYNVLFEDCTVEGQMDRILSVRNVETGGGEVAHVRYRNMTVLGDKIPPNQVSVITGGDAAYCHDIWLGNAPVGGDANTPDVYAGADRHLDAAGGSVKLTGTVKAKGTPTYKWSVIGGEAGGVTIAEPTALKTTATFGQEGVFILKLEATDGQAAGYHFMMVTVGEQEDPMTKVAKPIFTRP